MARVGQSIKVRYLGDKETGWATYLAPGLARIDNIPISEDINLHDIVEFKETGKNDLPLVTKVVHTEFPDKSLVYYHTEGQFHRLRDILTLVGAKVEGFNSPGDESLGTMAVAHTADIDPKMIAEGMGISQKSKKNGKKKED